MKKSNKRLIATEEFDRKFDSGDDVAGFLDTRRIKVNKKIQRVNIDFPTGFLSRIDREADRVGVARTALIKMWLAEHLKVC